MGQRSFNVSGLVPFTPATPEQLEEAGLRFEFFPPNIHTCAQVILRQAQSLAPTGLELGEIISHFKDDAVLHTEACKALRAKHLEDMVTEEIALLRRNLSRFEDEVGK